MEALRKLLARLGTLDLRALALFRMALALCVLYDVATRLRDFRDHYTDAGIVPIELASEMAGRVSRIYLPIWSHSSDLVVGALFALLVAAALALLVGFRTRAASVLCWLLITSLQVRNPLVASFGGDTVLRLLLFWAMFLPLGLWYSLDARRTRADAEQGSEERPTHVLSVASVALIAQMTILYVTTGLAKTGGLWADGTALWYALHCDYFGNSFGAWLRDQDVLLVPFSYAALWFERYAPLLLFVPFATDFFRMAAFVLFVGFHLSLAAFMDVGPFPLYTMAAWPAFLPGALFDRWLPQLSGRAEGAGPTASRRLRQPLWNQVIAAVCLVFVVGHVATNAQRWRTPSRRLPRVAAQFGQALQIHQNWDMFAPNPTVYDIWPQVALDYSDSSRLDPLNGESFERHRPEDIPGYVGSFRSRLYFRALYWADPLVPLPRLQEAFAHAHCRRDEPAEGDARLVAVTFAVGIERTKANGPDAVRYEGRGRVLCP